MLVTPEQLLAFTAAAMLITLSPGPDNLMVLSQGIARGRRQGVAFGLGCALGCLNHTVLAALGLLAVFAAESRGHDLRSRCLLVPKKGFSLALEAVARDGSTTPVDLDLAGVISLYNEAVCKLPSEIKFEKPAGEALAELQPSPKLADLVRRSRIRVAADPEALTADVGGP